MMKVPAKMLPYLLHFNFLRSSLLAIGFAGLMTGGQVLAQDAETTAPFEDLQMTQAGKDQPGAFDVSFSYTLDTVSQISGDGGSKPRVLDNLDFVIDADLDALLGARGLTAHAYVLANHGARPNDTIGTLQGVDNIEVPDSGVRLFEAWMQQEFGQDSGLGGSVLVGLYDLNSEFYVNDAAGLLLAPPFGIGSELAATGPNGPSIFPSSALAARLYLDFTSNPQGEMPRSRSGLDFLRVALVNARASTLGDHSGVDFSFDDGVLAIAELGASGPGGIAFTLGGWGYSEPRDHLFPDPAAPGVGQSRSYGVYASAQKVVWGEPGAGAAVFVRGGISDDKTTPFTGGGQAGILIEPAPSGREDSALSLGLHFATTSKDFAALTRSEGDDPASHETVIEPTWAEKLGDHIVIQPDLQMVFNPGGLSNSATAVVGILRVSLEL